MKAQKITCMISTQTLHKDSIPALLGEVAVLMQAENCEGELVKEDGDTISWSLEIKDVEI